MAVSADEISLLSRIFVATWNVGGKSPPSNLNLEDWLRASPLADIYVLGYMLHCHMYHMFESIQGQMMGASIQLLLNGFSGFKKLFL